MAAALRHLHRHAGEPTTREIGKEIGYSHTTVAQALKGSRCPSWPVIEKIVKRLGGNPEEFRPFWLAVRENEDPLPTGPEVGWSPGTGASQPAAEGRPHFSDGQPRQQSGREDSPVVMRVETRDEMIEFRHVGLAMQWIKARKQVESPDE